MRPDFPSFQMAPFSLGITISHIWARSLLCLALAAAVTSSPASSSTAPAAATTLRFATQPPDRPLALYRAPAPYLEPGRRALNSVIITSRPIGITEREALATTASPSTAASAMASSVTAPSTRAPPVTSRDSPLGAWRRFSSSSPSTAHGATTERPTLTLSLPQYSIDCAEGMSCSETIALQPSTPRPTFKPYPQDVLDKFLRELSAAAASRKDNDRRAEASSPERASNRLANLYLQEEEEDERSEERRGEQGALTSSEEDGEDDHRGAEGSEGKGRWHLLEAERHRHPYDDRDGWVTLEPVPWSTSKVAKWQPARPKPDRWDTRPSLQWEKPSRPQWVRPSYASPDDNYDRPQRPSSLWPHTPSRPSHWHSESKPHEYDFHKPSTTLQWASAGVAHDIVTDNRPNRWPEHQSNSGGGGGGGGGSYRPWDDDQPYGGGGGGGGGGKPHYDYSHQSPPHKRPGGGGGGYEYLGGHDSHRHPSTHPEEGEGQWVLVSSTKGYAMPHRHKIFQRALSLSGRPVTSRRSVRLTVLPAPANTSLSHGGLLEVHSSFHSVEEDQQQQQQLEGAHGSQGAQHVVEHELLVQHNALQAPQAVKPKAGPVRLLAHRAPQDNSRAVLAAVGAGMVPATIALMAPLVLGRRKRSATMGGQQSAQRMQKHLLNAFQRSPLHRSKKR